MSVRAEQALRRQIQADEAAPAPAPAAAPRIGDPLALASLAGVPPVARAGVLGALQRSAGNRSIAAVLAREPAQAADTGSPTWEVGLVPGGRAPDRPRELGDGGTVFRGDTITFRARFPGLDADAQEFTQVELTDGAAAGQVDGGWEDDDSYAIRVVMSNVGSHELVVDAASQGRSIGFQRLQLTAVMDVADWDSRLDAAATLAVAEFGDALAAATAAAQAWELAYARHEQVLSDALAKQRLVADLALDALLVVVAGGAGGALAGFLKHTAGIKGLNDQRTRVADMISTAITDAAKDGLKYAVRTMPKLGGVAGSTPAVPGDGKAPAGGSEVPLPEGDYVGQFLARLVGQLGQELGMITREIGRMQLAASDAMAVGSEAVFADDPAEIFTGDTSLDLLTRGLPSESPVYLEALWGTWLANYAYELTVVYQHSDMPFIGGDARVVLKSNLGWPLHGYLEEEAKSCGATLDAWLERYAAPLKAQLEAERDRHNAPEQPRDEASPAAPGGPGEQRPEQSPQ
jgi:hypothetical protein